MEKRAQEPNKVRKEARQSSQMPKRPRAPRPRDSRTRRRPKNAQPQKKGDQTPVQPPPDPCEHRKTPPASRKQSPARAECRNNKLGHAGPSSHQCYGKRHHKQHPCWIYYDNR
ncbi:hypothetical protein SUGI_0633260 [Cryptomeria japonica]|nr:hypothetical protein SUGI_0633260 [Cryptomeria japonica]